MNETQNIYIEIADKIAVPIILLIAGYIFGNKSKKIDVDIEKIKELNVVLSNILNSWHYLNKLSELLHLQKDQENELVFPKEFLPYITLKSGALNDNCFHELEQSIESLKKYDPICYFELVGIGKKIDYIKSNYILPFLKSSKAKPLNKLSRIFLDKLLNDIEQSLRHTSKEISKQTYLDIENKIQNLLSTDYKKLNEEFNYEYYQVMLSFLEDVFGKELTYEEFLVKFKEKNIQNDLQIQFEFIVKNGMEKVLPFISENPYISIEELEQKLIKN